MKSVYALSEIRVDVNALMKSFLDITSAITLIAYVMRSGSGFAGELCDSFHADRTAKPVSTIKLKCAGVSGVKQSPLGDQIRLSVSSAFLSAYSICDVVVGVVDPVPAEADNLLGKVVSV